MCVNPTAEQFKIIERFISVRRNYIDDIKAGKSSEKPSSKKKLVAVDGVIPVYEQTNKEQRLIKPPIDGCCDYFIKDSTLKQAVTRLLEFSRGLGMEPVWVSKNKYICRHKKMDVISYRIEGENDFNISMSAFGWRENGEDFGGFISSLSDDNRKKFIDIKEFHCGSCRDECAFLVKTEISGEGYRLCPRSGYRAENPATPEQLELVEWFIGMGRDYINFKTTKNKK
jgi:hypothetical protein